MQFTAVPPRGASGACTLCYRETAIRLTRPARPRSARVRGLVVVLGPLLSKMSNRTNSLQCTAGAAAAPLSPTGTALIAAFRFSVQRPNGTLRLFQPAEKGPPIVICVRTAKQSSRAHYILAGFPIPFSVLPPWATPVPEPTATSRTGAPVPTERQTEG